MDQELGQLLLLHQLLVGLLKKSMLIRKNLISIVLFLLGLLAVMELVQFWLQNYQIDLEIFSLMLEIQLLVVASIL